MLHHDTIIMAAPGLLRNRHFIVSGKLPGARRWHARLRMGAGRKVKARRRRGRSRWRWRGEGADSPSCCRSGRCEASGEGTGLFPFLRPIKKRRDKSGSVADRSYRNPFFLPRERDFGMQDTGISISCQILDFMRRGFWRSWLHQNPRWAIRLVARLRPCA